MSNLFLATASDEYIINNSNGEVTDASRFNLKSLEEDNFSDIEGGIYSSLIFGKYHRCKCGRLKNHGTCGSCGVTIIDETNEYDLYGYYNLSTKVIYEITIKNFLQDLSKITPILAHQFRTSNIKKVKELIWNTKIELELVDISKLTEQEENMYDYVFDESNNMYKVKAIPYDSSDTMDNLPYYGVNGLDYLFNNYKPMKGSFDSVKNYIRGLIVIAPLSMRRPTKDHNGKVKFPILSGHYSVIIDFDKKSIKIKKTTDKLADALMLNFIENNLIDQLLTEYKITATSKQSIVRYLSTVRLPKSGRAVITGDGSLDIDTIYIPEAMAYEAIKTDIISKIEEVEHQKEIDDPTYRSRDAMFMYNNVTPEVMKIFYAIIEGSEEYNESGTIAIINRAPTLHKLSMQAFRIKLTKNSTIAMNPTIVKGFNADFDGDQMGVYFLTKDPIKTKAFNKMGPKNNWFYNKNKKPVYVPDGSALLGLFYATRIRVYEGNTTKEFFSIDQIIDAKKKKEIKIDEKILLDGKITTMGREKVSSILGFHIDNLTSKYGNNGELIQEPITANNVGKLISYLGSFDNRTDIVSELVRYAGYVSTIMASSIATLGDLYKIDSNHPRIGEIINGNYSEDEKYRLLTEEIPNIIETTIKNIKSTTFEDAMMSGAKPKINSIIETFGPQLMIKDGKVKVFDSTIMSGLSEEALVNHATVNREILKQKAIMVPASGYFNRQFVNLMQDLLYKTDRLSVDTRGILIPKWMAVGRTLLTGELVDKNDSEELVRIKSSVGSNSNVICKDEINYNFYNYENNTKLGFDCSTSLCENITQSCLGLKHGGRTYTPSSDKLVAPVDLTLKSVSKDKITLMDSEGKYYIYPIPSNAVLSANLDNVSINAGDTIYYSGEIHYVDYKLAALKSLIGVLAIDLTTKNVVKRQCYSMDSGNINYDFENKKVIIGSFKIPLSDDVVYYYPHGSFINKGDKISSGVPIISYMLNTNKDLGECFYIFMKALIDLLYGEKVLKDHSLPISLESIELLFKEIVRGRGSVHTANLSNPKLLSKQNYGYNRQAVESNVNREILDSLNLRLILGDVEFKGYN